MRYFALLLGLGIACGKVDSQLPETGPVYLYDQSVEINNDGKIESLEESVSQLQKQLDQLLGKVEDGELDLSAAHEEIKGLRFLLKYYSVQKINVCDDPAFFIRLGSFYVSSPFTVNQQMADQIYNQVAPNELLLSATYKYGTCTFQVAETKFGLEEFQRKALKIDNFEIPLTQICWGKGLEKCANVLEGLK